MSVFSYEPFYNWDRFLDQVLSGSAASRDGLRAQRTNSTATPSELPRFLKPRMDLHEDASTNVVTATFEFPGLHKEDVSIELHDGRMTVSAESKRSEEYTDDGYAVKERRFGRWSRTLQLPAEVKDEEIKANMQDGILTVTFPKVAIESQPKKVSVV
ncbi:small heat shock protein [Mucidula mucida]|nr:small heat shock protein [Mucidula mucida]